MKLKELISFYRGHGIYAITSEAFKIAQVLVPLATAEAIRQIIIKLTDGEFSGMPMALGWLAFVMLCQSVVYYVANRLDIRFLNRMGKSLRQSLLNKLMAMDAQDYQQYTAGDILARYNMDINEMQEFLASFLPSVLTVFVNFAGTVIYVSAINVWLLPICIIPALLTFILLRPVLAGVSQAQQKLSQAQGEAFAGIKDVAYGITDIKAGEAESYFHKKNTIAFEAYAYQKITRDDKQVKIQFVSMLQHSLTYVLLVFAGGITSYLGMSTIADVVVTTSLFGRIGAPIRNFSTILAKWHRGMASVKRVNDVLTMPDEDSGVKSNFKINDPVAVVDIKKFTYVGRDAFRLCDIHCIFRQGCITAIVGRSGSGKSTLAKLLVGYSLNYTGSICVLGIDLCEANLTELRKKITYVNNEYFLPTLSIRENILPPGNEDLVYLKKLLCLVEMDEYVDSLEAGYDSLIQEDGRNLSGGQRQRLILAKALAVNSPVYILDEMFSSVDADQSQRILRNIRESYPRATFILITHRVETARAADHVIFIDDGKLVCQGKHDEMIQEHERYRQFVQSAQTESVEGGTESDS